MRTISSPRYARDARVGAALLDALVAAVPHPARPRRAAGRSRPEAVSARPTLPDPHPELADPLVRATEAGAGLR